MMPTLFLLLALSPAAEPVSGKLTLLPTPAQAQAAALLHLQTLPEGERLFTRYLWIPGGEKVSAQISSLGVNMVSRAGGNPVLLLPVAGGQLLPVNLKRFAPVIRDGRDLAEWLDLWEEFRFDPSFSTLITRDTLDLLQRAGLVFPTSKIPGVEKVGRRVLVKCKPYQQDGETFENRWVDVVRFQGKHLDPSTAAALELATHSEAPVVHYQYFLLRALSTIKGKGVFREVFGGLYYELIGVKESKDRNVTDEDLLFKRLGIGDNAKKVFDELRSDQGILILYSQVTAKQRLVDIIPLQRGKQDNLAILFVTHDPANEDVDSSQSPLMNWLGFKDAAREDIWTKRNGLHEFALFNGAGKLQEKAPDNVVKDHKVPAPHTAELQGAISCVRCHGDADGVKPLKNDAVELLKVLKPQGDVSDGELNKPISDTLDRIEGRTGEAVKSVTRARNDYIEAILRATGPWDEGKDQTEVGKLSSEALAREWADYNYARVDAHRALKEMGFDVPKRDARFWFRKLLPADESSRVFGLIPEDPRLGALAIGLTLSRTEWSLVQSFATARAQAAWAALPKGETKP